MKKTNGHTNGTANGHEPVNRVADVLPPASSQQPSPAPSQPSANGAAPSPGRGPGGRFAKENRFGGGNPFARRVSGLRAAFLDAVTEADVTELARALLKKALAGDVAAAHLFLSYALGKPAAVRDPDLLDLDELALLFRRPEVGAGHLLHLPRDMEGLKEQFLMQIMERRHDDEDDSDKDDSDEDDLDERLNRLEAMLNKPAARPK